MQAGAGPVQIFNLLFACRLRDGATVSRRTLSTMWILQKHWSAHLNVSIGPAVSWYLCLPPWLQLTSWCALADILKFFGCELGAQTNYDKNTGTSIVNGAHDSKKLCELLEAFIKKYVQCYSCGNPETTVKIKKEFIYLKCKACGYVSDVDMRHKVNTFILKNPPENKMSKEEKK
jgi:translation initiation factor 2 beta subunit (eIF-2beta)/eIF-5